MYLNERPFLVWSVKDKSIEYKKFFAYQEVPSLGIGTSEWTEAASLSSSDGPTNCALTSKLEKVLKVVASSKCLL